MLTNIPTVRDWSACAAVPASLSALAGAIVPGYVRQVDTVFEVFGLQVMGATSVRSESDEWLLQSCGSCKRALPCQDQHFRCCLLCAQVHPTAAVERRLAIRVNLADSNAHCQVVLYHDIALAAAASLEVQLPDTLQDTPALRQQVLTMLRSAQWLCRFTFRSNEQQEILELELRYLTPCLRSSGSEQLLPTRPVGVPHCHLHTGCPIAALSDILVDAHLGLLIVGQIEGTTVRALVAFNDVELQDEEALQQDSSATSAMRVKRCVDCLLSPSQADVPFRAKLRCAGPASVVNWMLRGTSGQVFQVVLGQASEVGEWTVLWHAPVAPMWVDKIKACWLELAKAESQPAAQLYDVAWTPCKRISAFREALPVEAKGSAAWEPVAGVKRQ